MSSGVTRFRAGHDQWGQMRVRLPALLLATCACAGSVAPSQSKLAPVAKLGLGDNTVVEYGQRLPRDADSTYYQRHLCLHPCVPAVDSYPVYVYAPAPPSLVEYIYAELDTAQRVESLRLVFSEEVRFDSALAVYRRTLGKPSTVQRTALSSATYEQARWSSGGWTFQISAVHGHGHLPVSGVLRRDPMKIPARRDAREWLEACLRVSHLLCDTGSLR